MERELENISKEILDSYAERDETYYTESYDPNNLPQADKSSMNFGSGGNTDAKAWKDIWGSGQGIGSIKDSPSVQILVDQLTSEFKEAVKDLNQKSTY